MVGTVIVTVQGLLPNCKGGANCWAVFVIDSGSGKMLVDVVHGWDYGGNRRRAVTGEKKGGILENLPSI
jgi:hypothetical protein